MTIRKKVDLVILSLVALVGFIGLRNAVAIGDFVHSISYTPPPLVSELSDSAGFSPEGKALFFRFEPQVLPQPELREACGGGRLGCIEGRFIYILDWSSERTRNQAIVTAAHEMLHVPYSRFSDAQKAALTPLLDAELAAADASDIRLKLMTYPAADYYDEAHSFIGTEKTTLSAELEAHYAQYFSNRSVTVTAHTNSANP